MIPNCIDIPQKRLAHHWKQFERARFPSYNRNRSFFGRMLNRIYQIGIDALRESPDYQTGKQRAILRIEDDAPSIIEDTYQTVYENTAQEFARNWGTNSKQEDEDQDLSTLALLAVRDYLTASLFVRQEQTLAQHVTNITGTHAAIFGSALEQQAVNFLGLDPGEPVPQVTPAQLNNIALLTRARLRNKITPTHSQYFSTTETVGASNLGILAVARAQQQRTGQRITKGWLSQRDRRVRDEHVIADGNQIGLNQLFNVGGSLLAFPGDWTHGASLDMIINCRCVIIFFTEN